MSTTVIIRWTRQIDGSYLKEGEVTNRHPCHQNLCDRRGLRVESSCHLHRPEVVAEGRSHHICRAQDRRRIVQGMAV
jgi:hypothetical protein